MDFQGSCPDIALQVVFRTTGTGWWQPSDNSIRVNHLCQWRSKPKGETKNKKPSCRVKRAQPQFWTESYKDPVPLTTYQSAGPTIMQYSNIRSRAGLVALVFAIIISLVSAVPIPSTEFGLSSTLSHRSNGQGVQVQPATAEFPFSGPAATKSPASRVRCYYLSRYLIISSGPGLRSYRRLSWTIS